MQRCLESGIIDWALMHHASMLLLLLLLISQRIAKVETQNKSNMTIE